MTAATNAQASDNDLMDELHRIPMTSLSFPRPSTDNAARIVALEAEAYRTAKATGERLQALQQIVNDAQTEAQTLQNEHNKRLVEIDAAIAELRRTQEPPEE